MSGRALLNLIETDLLTDLDGDARADMLWSLRDPRGFTAENDRRTLEAAAAIGGEIG